MLERPEIRMIRERYQNVFGATLRPAFPRYVIDKRGAALGYRRAGDGPLFVEQYLDGPVEGVVASAFSRPVERGEIVELGNFAAKNAIAMVELWGMVANDLAGPNDIAVATLTAPLRQMFRRIGLPFVALAPAAAGRLQAPSDDWGIYYSFDPQVCAGVVADGQVAIDTFLSRRNERKAVRA